MLFPWHGRLHASLKWLQMILQHALDLDLLEIRKESSLFKSNSAEKVIIRITYAHGVCAQKPTTQTIWQVLLPLLLWYFEKGTRNSKKLANISSSAKHTTKANDNIGHFWKGSKDSSVPTGLSGILTFDLVFYHSSQYVDSCFNLHIFTSVCFILFLLFFNCMIVF